MTRPAPAPGRTPAAADLAWYGVLREIGQAQPRWDLATGQPLHDPEIGGAVASALAAAAARPGIGARLATYRDLDGAPELRSAATAMLSASLGRDVTGGELLVVPGAQAALRSVQAVMRAAGRRLLFPVGLEYPGAADPQAALPPSAGAGRWSAGGTVIDMQPDLLDWDQVGAVIISRPHSPTGRIWPAGQMRRLRDDAARRGAWLVIDETFSLPAMPLQAEPVQPVDGPGVVHLWSFSKAGLAAERLALVAARPEVIAVLRRELRASAIAASYLGQLLAAALLEAAARDGTGSRLGALYQQRWQALRGALAAALPGDAGAAVARWQGGPFLWLSWAGGPDDMAVFRELLRRGVGVTPGSTVHVTGEPVRAVRVGLDAPAGQIGQVGALIGAGLRAAAAGGRPPARHAGRRPARSRAGTGVLGSGAAGAVRGLRCRQPPGPEPQDFDASPQWTATGLPGPAGAPGRHRCTCTMPGGSSRSSPLKNPATWSRVRSVAGAEVRLLSSLVIVTASGRTSLAGWDSASQLPAGTAAISCRTISYGPSRSWIRCRIPISITATGRPRSRVAAACSRSWPGSRKSASR